MIAISDTGIGIDEKNIPSLLEAFTQESDGLARNYEGGGLGLCIVKGLLALHNAELAIASKPNVGTTVTLGFPAHRTVDGGIDLDATMIHIPRRTPNLDNALFLEFGGRKVSVFPDAGNCILGRNRDKPPKVVCDVVVEDLRVSRPHAFIRYVGDGYYLVDESQWGTYVTGDGGSREFACRDRPIRLNDCGTIYLGVAPEEPDAQPIRFYFAAEA